MPRQPGLHPCMQTSGKFVGAGQWECPSLHLQVPLGKPLQPQQLFVAWTQPKQPLTKLIVIKTLSHVPVLPERGGLEYMMLGVESQVSLPPAWDPHSTGPSAMKWFLCHNLSIRINKSSGVAGGGCSSKDRRLIKHAQNPGFDFQHCTL